MNLPRRVPASLRALKLFYAYPVIGGTIGGDRAPHT